MAQCVLDKVGDRLCQQLLVAAQGDARRDLGIETVSRLLRVRPVGVRHRLQHAAEIHGTEAGPRRAALHLRDAQQGREGVQHVLRIAHRTLDRRLVLGDGPRVRQRALQPLAQPRQWRAQVVRHVAADLAQAVHQGGDAVQHVVQRAGQAVQVVAGAAHRHAPREVALDDRLRRAGDRVHPREERPAEQDAAADAQQGRQPDRPGQGRGHSLLHL